jgi:hypothetical protein
MNHSTMFKGVIQGKIIELEREPGLAPGQPVLVSIMPQLETNNQQELAPGEGLRQAFGGWADDGEELDEYLEWTRQQRKIQRPAIE